MVLLLAHGAKDYCSFDYTQYGGDMIFAWYHLSNINERNRSALNLPGYSNEAEGQADTTRQLTHILLDYGIQDVNFLQYFSYITGRDCGGRNMTMARSIIDWYKNNNMWHILLDVVANKVPYVDMYDANLHITTSVCKYFSKEGVGIYHVGKYACVDDDNSKSSIIAMIAKEYEDLHRTIINRWLNDISCRIIELFPHISADMSAANYLPECSICSTDKADATLQSELQVRGIRITAITSEAEENEIEEIDSELSEQGEIDLDEIYKEEA